MPRWYAYAFIPFFYLFIILFTNLAWHPLFQIYGENQVVFIEWKTKHNTTKFRDNVNIP